MDFYLPSDQQPSFVIPSKIGNLRNLEEVTFHDLNFTSLPDEFCNLTCLKEIDFKNSFLITCEGVNLQFNFAIRKYKAL